MTHTSKSIEEQVVRGRRLEYLKREAARAHAKRDYDARNRYLREYDDLALEAWKERSR